MPSHMGVQRFATSRNAQTEIFIEFLLEQFCERMKHEDALSDYNIESQKHYISDISSDIWDHFVTYFDQNLNETVELWCQTTCYKGNKTGKPEPNKTYEVRETLVEAISFRNYVTKNKNLVRTIHFTVGSKKYTYDWFASAKEKTFDKSVYLEIPNEDIFQEIAALFKGAKAEFQVKSNLLNQMGTISRLGSVIDVALTDLLAWSNVNQMPIQAVANEQFMLVESRLEELKTEIHCALSRAKNSGLDIKKMCNDVVHGKKSSDRLINKTVDVLLKKNPFIKSAKSALANWDSFIKSMELHCESAKDIYQFVHNLWVSNKELSLIVRRLLMRIGAEEAINYVQDVNIDGITEHNLYKGTHTGEQLELIVSHVIERLPYDNKGELLEALTSKSARRIIQSSVWFEARNGTSLKPSFDYISLAIKSEGYAVEAASRLGEKPVGYHSRFAKNGETVKPYSNLKVILDSDNNVIAYLKGKYFNPPEFPRRCKEEAYVSLTLGNDYIDQKFINKVQVPIIMFIDMPKEYEPPEYSLKRLMAFGWSLAFNLQDILDLITNE